MPGLKLVAELGGDGSGFDAMMRRAGLAKDRFAAQFSGLKNIIAGAFTVGAIANLTRQTIAYGSHLQDISDALSVNVEWFQKRANAAKLAGATEDDLFKTLDSINKARAAAVQNPAGEQAQAFGKLGLSSGDISQLSPAAFFDKITRAFASGANQGTDAAVEAVGGKSARKLLAAFKTGFDSDLPVLTADMVAQLDAVDDAFTGLKTTLMVDLAPAIVWVADRIKDLFGTIKQAGAFLGGATSNVVRNIRSETSPKNSWQENVKAMWRGLMKSFDEGATAVIAEEADQQNAADQMASAAVAARAARKTRNDAAPGFTRDDSADKPARGPHLPTDALVGIGNFLGRNSSLVNNIAEQTLQVARQHLAATLSVRDAVNNLSRLNSTAAGTLGIPGT